MIPVSAYFPVRRGTARRLGLADPRRRRPTWQDALRAREQPVVDAIERKRLVWRETWTEAFRSVITESELAGSAFRFALARGTVMPIPTHPYPGTDSERQSVGQPGHCEECAQLGHVRAHPDLGCGDVGCTVAHEPGQECDR